MTNNLRSMHLFSQFFTHLLEQIRYHDKVGATGGLGAVLY